MSPKFFSLFCFASPEIIWVKVCDRHSAYQTLRQTDCQILRYLIYIEINTKCKLISRLVLTNLILSWTILKTSNKYHDWSKSQPRCVAFLGPNFMIPSKEVFSLYIRFSQIRLYPSKTSRA